MWIEAFVPLTNFYILIYREHLMINSASMFVIILSYLKNEVHHYIMTSPHPTAHHVSVLMLLLM